MCNWRKHRLYSFFFWVQIPEVNCVPWSKIILPLFPNSYITQKSKWITQWKWLARVKMNQLRVFKVRVFLRLISPIFSHFVMRNIQRSYSPEIVSRSRRANLKFLCSREGETHVCAERMSLAGKTKRFCIAVIVMFFAPGVGECFACGFIGKYIYTHIVWNAASVYYVYVWMYARVQKRCKEF